MPMPPPSIPPNTATRSPMASVWTAFSPVYHFWRFSTRNRNALLAVAVVPHPQRNSLLPDASFALRLEVNVHAELDQRLEAFLRFVKTERNHVRRDDEIFRIRELRTPPERVAVQPPPQG